STVNSEEILRFTRSSKLYAILVIDNDPANLVVIENIFTSNENQIVGTSSVKVALQLLEDSAWDLVIIDAMMPIESGYSLTQLIRQKFTKLELPILLLTARSYPLDVYTALSSGAN